MRVIDVKIDDTAQMREITQQSERLNLCEILLEAGELFRLLCYHEMHLP